MATKLVVTLENHEEVPFVGENLDPVVLDGVLRIVDTTEGTFSQQKHIGVFGLGTWKYVLRGAA